MIGGTQDEGGMFMPQFLNDPQLLDRVNQDFDVQGPILWLGKSDDDVTEEDSAVAWTILKNYISGIK